MKGQFFVLGAIIIITLFFAGLPPKDGLIKEKTDDIVFLFDNVNREYPFALNNALNMSDDADSSIDRLMNFTRFTDRLLSERLINYSSLWVVGWNISSNFNITVGNYLQYDTIVLLNLSGTEFNLSVSFNSTNSTVFSASDTFSMNISFGGYSKNSTWVRDRVNLYTFIIMQRGENQIIDEYMS